MIHEGEFIKSFIVFEEFKNFIIIHYIYTRRVSRNKGHGFSLFKKILEKNKTMFFTFLTFNFVKMLEKNGVEILKDNRISYNPYLRVLQKDLSFQDMSQNETE